MQKPSNTNQQRRSAYARLLGVFTAVMLSGILLFITDARASGLSGTYTIDPSGSGNYSTFKAAVTALTDSGVAGPVVFNVAAGTYSETVTIGTITGASATNTILFQGAGRGKTFLSSTGTIVTVSAYTTFGNMSIVSTGTALIKATNSISCGFINCNLTGLAGGTGDLIIASTSKNFTLYNCEVSGGGYGLYSIGNQASTASGYMRCSHNRFIEQYYVGIEVEYDYLDSFAYNVFDSSYADISGSGYLDEAIYLYAPNGIVIWGNKSYVDCYYGLELSDPDEYPVTGSPTQSYFVNNEVIIPSAGSSNYEGIDINLYNNSNFTFAFNTIIDKGALNEGVYFGANNSSNIIFANNIIYGSTVAHDGQLDLYNYNSAFKLFDGNDIYATTSSTTYPIVSYYNGSSTVNYMAYASYAAGMQANGWEMHGTNTAPPFISMNSPYNLDMSASAAAPKGVGGTGIPIDIDLKGRFSTPTPGASESYFGIENNNAGITAMISPVAQCPGTAVVSVVVSNQGLNPINNGVTVSWTWNGTAQPDVTFSNQIPLYQNDTVVIGSVSLASGISNSLKAWVSKTNGINNAGGANDTLNVNGIMAAISSGTFTIDASKASSSTNFKTFGSAVASLAPGICGPVVFNVAKGTYSEAIVIGNISGASPVNTITFAGAGRTATTISSAGVPVTLNKAMYVNFNNMGITTTGSGNVVTDNGSVGCHFLGDNLIAPIYSSNSGYVIGSQGSSGLKVNACRIVGGYYSLKISSNLDTFTNNRINSSGYAGIYITGGYGNDFEHNVLDSVSDPTPEYGIYSSSEKGNTWNANAIYMRQANGQPAKVFYGWDCLDPNETAFTPAGSKIPMNFVFTNNIIDIPLSNELPIDFDCYSATGPVIVAFNTFKCGSQGTAGSGGYESEIYIENNAAKTTIWASNIMESDNANSEAFYMYISTPGFVGAVPQWDNGDTLFDGDDIISSGSPQWVQGSFTASNLASYKAALNPQGYERNATSIEPNFLNSGANPLFLDTTKAGPIGVNVCGPVSSSSINFAGVTTDFTGRKRCNLFPTAGAYEDPFGKSSIKTKIYVPASGVYPGSPSTIYQSHAAGSPAVYVWYVENGNYSAWQPVSTSTDLYYSGWTTGTNKLKLVTQSCTGTDSDSVSITVNAPVAVPIASFIANANTIQQNTSVQFTDLTTNGPIKWLWAISPDSITVGSVKVPTTNQYDGNPQPFLTQNPQIAFLYPGYYQVCLTAYNALGKSLIDCKPNFINVVPATNLADTQQVLTTPTGYVYDNGGPGTEGIGNYKAIGAPYIESVLIKPCADSIYLTFSQFDTRCGTDFVQLYNGSAPVAANAIAPCTGVSTVNGMGPGFNGGPTNTGCATYCIPNVNNPDTFKAGKTMLLTMSSYTGGAPGFAAYYWTKPSTDKKVTPSFSTSDGKDTVCAGQIVNYTNTTTINPADVPTFEWDLNGDLSDGFECIGACATAQWPYFLPGQNTITLIATNCGGDDTFTKTITVITPPKPVAAFAANNIAPTTSDVVTLTSSTVQCVDDYKWAITASAGTVGGAAARFVNGTTATSQSPQVTFPDTGYYDVSLFVENAGSTQNNTLLKKKYIHVRNPYCTPSVAELSSDIGISHVVFNTIDNYTQPQAAQAYLNFTGNAAISTNIAIGATYNLSVSRTPNGFSPINRDVYIDWNQDGFFTSAGETVLKDSNSTSDSYTAKVTVPINAKMGATVMRVAVNLNLYPNVPCGPNQFGQFEDYRVYVTPYNILPVITLKGVSGLQDTIVVEQGHPYTEPGDSASSFLYGNISKDIKVTSKEVGGGASFNNLVAGTYIFSYNVTDSAGNKAITQYRVVRITHDVTPPDLIVSLNKVSGTDTIYEEVTKTQVNLKPSLSSYLVSSIDLVDGNLTSIVAIDSSLVQTTEVGVYPVTYTSSDLDSNIVTVVRYVDVIDTIRPVITLTGANPDTVEVYVPFVDPGVTITDPNGYFKGSQLTKYLHITSSVDDSVPGTYNVTYSLIDSLGNQSVPVVRTVIVADKLPPIITLSGSARDSILVDNIYQDAGYTVSDNYSKTAAIKVTASGTFVTAFKNNFADKLGGGHDSAIAGPAYRLTYTATDQAGNKSTTTRYIEVYDNIAPVVALVGPPVVNVCRWFPYIDYGYTVSDNYSDSTNIKVRVSTNYASAGGTNLSQTLYYQYFATDQAGNTSHSDARTIYVLPESAAQCASGIQTGLTLDKYISVFPNPSSGIFNIKADLPSTKNVRISVINTLGQEIMVVHDGALSDNNFKVDLSSASGGIYFLKIVSENQSVTKQIEVAR